MTELLNDPQLCILLVVTTVYLVVLVKLHLGDK